MPFQSSCIQFSSDLKTQLTDDFHSFGAHASIYRKQNVSDLPSVLVPAYVTLT